MIRLALLAVAAATLVLAAPAAAAPPLGVPEATLERALTCAGDLGGGERAPVLLVHGTGSNVQESWESGYLHALPRAGVPACAVELPERAMTDIQISSEYVVFAIRRMAWVSGRRVSVVGHSQGGLEPLWALRFWEDLRGLVDDVIGLAAPYQGTETANGSCDDGACPEAVWQMRQGSRFLAAMHGSSLPAGPSYTSIATLNDVVVSPQPAASRLEGARNIVLQDICPGRPVDHLNIIYDNVTYELVLDALGHPGPADPARLSPLVCASASLPYDESTFAQNTAAAVVNVAVALTTYPTVLAEPALFCYADPSSPRGVQTYCPRAAPGAATERRPALRLAVSRRTVPRGRPVTLRFRVTSRGRPIARARVALAGRATRTDRLGRATLVVRFARARRHVARATRAGFRPGRATVAAIAPPRARFTG